MKQKTVALFTRNYKKTGNETIKMKLDKASKQYGLKPTGEGAAISAVLKPVEAGGYKSLPGYIPEAPKIKVPKNFSPEDAETFKQLKGISDESHAKSWMSSAETLIAQGKAGNLSKQDVSHIRAYTGHAYRKTNEQLRLGSVDVDVYEHSQHLTNAIRNNCSDEDESHRRTNPTNNRQPARYAIKQVSAGEDRGRKWFHFDG